MKKVSFDFDDTLDRVCVQHYAKSLVGKGIEVWIVTSRLSDDEAPSEFWNVDLYKVAKEVGIKPEHIQFQAMSDKYLFFEGKDFIWHLDDDNTELDLLNKHTKTKGISVYRSSNWKSKCDNLLN